MSVNTSSYGVIDRNDNFFRLPHLSQERNKFRFHVDEMIAHVVTLFPQISNPHMSNKIKQEITQRVDTRIKKLIQKLARKPFENHLGLQGNSFEKRKFCSEFVLADMDAYIELVNRLVNQPIAIEEQENNEEEESVDLETNDDSDSIEETPSPTHPYLLILEDQLEKLRQENLRLLGVLHGEKDVNTTLIDRLHAQSDNAPSLHEIEKLDLAHPEPNVDPQILDMLKMKRTKHPLPVTLAGRLEKKIEGVKSYQYQLKKKIEKAKHTNYKARRLITTPRQIPHPPSVIFQNGMTHERWKELIPYSDSDSESSIMEL